MNPVADKLQVDTLEAVCQHIDSEAFRRWDKDEDFARQFGVLDKALPALKRIAREHTFFQYGNSRQLMSGQTKTSAHASNPIRIGRFLHWLRIENDESDPTGAVRSGAAEALGILANIGVLSLNICDPAAQALLAQLQTADETCDRMGRLTRTLGPISIHASDDTRGQVIRFLLARTRGHANIAVRHSGVESLAVVGQHAHFTEQRHIVRALVRSLLRDEYAWVRAKAAEALGTMGLVDERRERGILRALLHAMRDGIEGNDNPFYSTRNAAARALGIICRERDLRILSCGAKSVITPLWELSLVPTPCSRAPVSVFTWPDLYTRCQQNGPSQMRELMTLVLQHRLQALRQAGESYALVTGPLITDAPNPTGFEAHPWRLEQGSGELAGVIVDLETLE